MPINIPTIINELRENATEEQRKALSILENRFYECIELKKESAELVQKIHILNEANMSLENTVGKFGEQLKEANEVIKKYAGETFEMETPNFVGTSISFDPVFGRQIEDMYDGTINVDVPYSNDETPAKDYLEKWGVK